MEHRAFFRYVSYQYFYDTSYPSVHKFCMSQAAYFMHGGLKCLERSTASFTRSFHRLTGLCLGLWLHERVQTRKSQ